MSIIPNNISSLSNPTLIGNAKNQLISSVQGKVKQTILTKADEIKNRINEIKNKIVIINKEYDALVSNIQNDSTLSTEEKNNKINEVQQKRSDELNLLNEDINKLTTDLSNIVLDPLKKAKEEKKKIDRRIKSISKKSKINIRLSNISRNKQVLQNASKNISAIIFNQLTNIFLRFSAQNVKLQELVDKTNAIIEEANESNSAVKLQQARILRNTALAILNAQEQKLTRIKNVLDRIKTVINIISVVLRIIRIIFSIPKPFGPGPSMPTPITFRVIKLSKLLDDASLAVSIFTNILNEAIIEIQFLKTQLLEIGNVLDGKASTNLTQIEFNTLISSGGGAFIGTLNETYKGFKFAIKEETGPNAKVVAGNKRRYAVAIDTNNVEVLKSELSFTLDPNDLVETLKVIIDRENLIA